MPTKTEEKLKKIYNRGINLPVSFDFILKIGAYVKFVEKTPLLKKMIENEHQDLRSARHKIPKARNEKEYEIMQKILGEKLYTNCSEDYMELVFATEAEDSLKKGTLGEEIEYIKKNKHQSIWDRIQLGIWELYKNETSKNNYYHTYEKDIKAKWQKVHRYLLRQLANPDVQEVVQKSQEEKLLKLEYINGILILKGKRIVIKPRKANTNENRLLEYIFSDRKSLGKTIPYADIAENAFGDYDYDKSKSKWRKYYDICIRINAKIPKLITEKLPGANKDFLIATSERAGTVRINELFL